MWILTIFFKKKNNYNTLYSTLLSDRNNNFYIAQAEINYYNTLYTTSSVVNTNYLIQAEKNNYNTYNTLLSDRINDFYIAQAAINYYNTLYTT